MRTEYRFFAVPTLFLLGVSVVYAWWTASLSTNGQPEWAGTAALALSTALCGMVWLYLWLVSRRIEPRPEDRADAGPSDGAGDIGFFSPGSYWPFGVALAAATAAFGIAMWHIWLIALGVAGVLLTSGGLLFEYYTGTRRGGA